MSAETLREAARLMRERAENAPEETRTSGQTIGVWLNSAYHMTTTPAVALAVADWLNVVAAEVEHQDHSESWEPFEAALAVARAYLGEPS